MIDIPHNIIKGFFFCCMVLSYFILILVSPTWWWAVPIIVFGAIALLWLFIYIGDA